MNENRQIFINAYLSNGYNATQAYKTAYPNCKSGHKQAGSRLLTCVDVQEAINERKKLIDMLWEDRIKRVIARLDSEMAKTTSISSVCLAANAQKGYMEMQAKNEGKYAADNAQRTEEAKLTEAEIIEAKEIARLRTEEQLKGNPKIIPIQEGLNEPQETKDVQRQGQTA